MRTLHVTQAGILLTASIALAGCSTAQTQSRLHEYETRASEIHAGMLAQVHASSAVEVPPTSQAQFEESELLGGRETDTAFWTTWSTVTLATTALPADVADAVGTYLLTEKWTADPLVDQGGTMTFIKVYRLAEADGDWVVQIAWPDPDADPRISLSVQSPLTVRGTISTEE
ncbi:hypothetical protein [Cryobacterium aureum]|uniref:hypothetical protein n=1 Tax=Cryobacterium aureum TaxID=995037 RepID=UPI00101AEAF4|nr:hypothetical protein [Cryobacterium aureum]